MASVEYSPTKVDLFFPARRGNFFSNISPDNDDAVCAEMSRLAYCRKEPAFEFDRDTITGVLAKQGFTAVQFFEDPVALKGRGAHCFIASDPARDLSIVSFRGTDASDPSNLRYDADARHRAWKPAGNVHRGFADALDALLQHGLLVAVQNLSGRTFYTGHSLGGAMATLLASLHNPAYLCTIGSPLVGDQQFVDTLKDVKVRRFVDCCDIVARVPPPSPWYAHFGKPSYIDLNRNLHENPSGTFMFSDRFRAAAYYFLKYAWHKENVGVRELADHAPINYIAVLK